MENLLSLEEIEERLKKLKKFALRQVADAVGVKFPSKYGAEELRLLISGIAKGVEEQIPEEKRKLAPEQMMFNGDVARAVLYYAEKHGQ